MQITSKLQEYTYIYSEKATYNAKGTDAFSIQSHVLGITLSYNTFTTICNKHANGLRICIKATAGKTLKKFKDYLLYLSTCDSVQISVWTITEPDMHCQRKVATLLIS